MVAIIRLNGDIRHILFTASESEVGDDYCKINYDMDHTGEDAVNGEGATFLFNMSAPVGQIWVASIDNAQDFTLWVDGKKASEGESGDTTTADGKRPHTEGYG